MITLKQTPPDRAALYVPLIHSALSDNLGEANFRYIADVYQGADLIVRFRLIPDPVTGFGVLDAGPVVRNLVPDYLAGLNVDNLLALSTQAWKVGYRVAWGEEYDGTFDPGLADAGTTTVYNVTPKPFPGANPYGDFSADGFGGLLSSRPGLGIAMIPTARMLVPFTYAAAVASVNITWTIYDGSGTSLGTGTQPATLGPYGLYVLCISGATTNATAFADPAAARVDVTVLRNGPGTGPSTLFATTVALRCSGKTRQDTMHFMNRFGAVESFVFDGTSRDKQNVTRKSFERNGLQVFGESLVQLRGRMYAEGAINYTAEASTSTVLTTQALSDAEASWLRELLVSPRILLDRDGYLYPATIKTADWSERYILRDKCYTLTIEVTKSTDTTGQLR